MNKFLLLILLSISMGCAAVSIRRLNNGDIILNSSKDVSFGNLVYSHTSTNGEIYTVILSNYNGSASTVIDAQGKIIGNTVSSAITATIEGLKK